MCTQLDCCVCWLQPGVASVHCAILQKSPGSVSFFLREFPELAGQEFREVRRKFADAVICGIFRSKTHSPILNPGDKEIVQQGDRVIALSNNSEQLALLSLFWTGARCLPEQEILSIMHSHRMLRCRTSSCMAIQLRPGCSNSQASEALLLGRSLCDNAER